MYIDYGKAAKVLQKFAANERTIQQIAAVIGLTEEEALNLPFYIANAVFACRFMEDWTKLQKRKK